MDENNALDAEVVDADRAAELAAQAEQRIADLDYQRVDEQAAVEETIERQVDDLEREVGHYGAVMDSDNQPESVRAPFPYFGGKSRVAGLVWERFRNVSNYVEPFAGSLAVLLGRPAQFEPRVETVNDVDALLANFWRALQHDPDAVAYWADMPVNETELHARHAWLVYNAKRRMEMLAADPEFYDAQAAGYWVYGQCLWIGSGWCADPGRRRIARKRPSASGHGQGVGIHLALDRKQPRGGGNAGVHARRWQGGGQGGGSGVHAPRLSWQKPQLSGDGSGSSHGALSNGILHTIGLYDYMGQLASRLRRVRVCCGDWRRVLVPSLTTYVGLTGVFLDPPYDQDQRAICYAEDHDICHDVAQWAVEHGDDPQLRIALCGYEGMYEMPATWERAPWKAHGGYSRTDQAVENRGRERVWFSPHCANPDARLPLE